MSTSPKEACILAEQHSTAFSEDVYVVPSPDEAPPAMELLRASDYTPNLEDVPILATASNGALDIHCKYLSWLVSC